MRDFIINDGAALVAPFFIAEKLERFSMPVTECGCQIWLGSLDDGYGHIKIDGHPIGVHRLSYAINFGPIPSGIHVLHSCDLRCCIRPDHLFLGTNDDNMQDRNLKGRQAFGEGHGLAALTVADVIKIRATAGTLQEIADLYGVHLTTIHRIRRRKTWVHVS